MVILNIISGQISTTAALLHETETDEYNLTIRAVDFGIPQRSANTSVYISISLNYPPSVPAVHKFEVQENIALTNIGQIIATDRNIVKGQNDELSYFIDERIKGIFLFLFYI